MVIRVTAQKYTVSVGRMKNQSPVSMLSGFVFCPADLPQSAYGMGLVALSSVKIEVMAGLSLDTSTLRIRLSFIQFSICVRRVPLRANVARGFDCLS